MQTAVVVCDAMDWAPGGSSGVSTVEESGWVGMAATARLEIWYKNIRPCVPSCLQILRLELQCCSLHLQPTQSLSTKLLHVPRWAPRLAEGPDATLPGPAPSSASGQPADRRRHGAAPKIPCRPRRYRNAGLLDSLAAAAGERNGTAGTVAKWPCSTNSWGNPGAIYFPRTVSDIRSR